MLLASPAFAEPAAPSIAVWFSPHKPGPGCTAAIVEELDAAKKEVLVQAYSFTSAPIAKALADAKKRGVAVTVIMDAKRLGETYNEADYLTSAGVTVYSDPKHAIAHNKVIVIDSRVVVTGSFNFTQQAELRNAENLLVLRDIPPIAEAYRENFQVHQKHSELYAKRRR